MNENKTHKQNNQNSKYYLDKEVDLISFFKFMWRGKFWIFFSILFSLFVAIAYLSQAPKRYTAIAKFGFTQKSSKLVIPQDVAFLGNLMGAQNQQSDILTQIIGGDFLRPIILELDLINDNEFYKKEKNKSKMKIFPFFENFINNENTGLISKNVKADLVLKKLLKSHLYIEELKTGGYQIKVISKNAEKSALIANIIAQKFLSIRLQNKINNSEKALDYLSQKLSEAKSLMEEANTKTEIFALERNVLSTEEFASQSNRLKEFRTTIDKQNSKIKKLESYFINLKSNSFPNEEYEEIISQIVDLSPRIKPARPFFDSNGTRDFKKEINHIIINLPKEINRLKVSKEITLSGFKALELKAKITSSDARELRKLRMEATFAISRYEALLEEFEKQSIIEGYKDALGEIYETAITPIEPTEPKNKSIITLSIVVGLLVGILIAAITSYNSRRIFEKSIFDLYWDNLNTVSVSSKLNNEKKVLDYMLKNKIDTILGSDLVTLSGVSDPIFQEIQKDKKNKVITIASFGSKNSAISLAFMLAQLFMQRNKKTIIYDSTSKAESIYKFLKRKKLVLENYYKINSSISYKKIAKKLESLGIDTINKEGYNLINVVENLQTNTDSFVKITESDFFYLISNSGNVKINDLQRISSALEHYIHKCLACMLVSK